MIELVRQLQLLNWLISTKIFIKWEDFPKYKHVTRAIVNSFDEDVLHFNNDQIILSKRRAILKVSHKQNVRR